MAETRKTHRLMSVEEYLELEKEATERHEFVGGVVHAMTRPTLRHNRIAGNIYRRLADKAVGGPCRVYIENAKVRIEDDIFYYPDIMAVCGPESDDAYFETDPCLLVEVVSPSTEHIDRREKFAFYQSIPTLKAYLIVEQNRPVVERFFRDEEGEWGRAAHFETGSFPVPCPEMRLSLAEIYEGL
ncbi:MAG: Uma2 family endonuclease [Rubrobacteraceae bacterium]|jgi:Uma2 family endonuclease|nr:Uma2 family endonuclease [Rubrobacter sp.]